MSARDPIINNYNKLWDACASNRMHLEISRQVSEKPHRDFFTSGKSNFTGWILRVVKGDKRICRAKMRPNDSFDDIAIDLYAYLKKEKHI